MTVRPSKNIEYILPIFREAVNIQHIAIFRRQKPPYVDQHLGGRSTCPIPPSRIHKIGLKNPQNGHLNAQRRLKIASNPPFGPFCSRVRFVAEPAAGRRRHFWSGSNMLSTFRREMKSQHVNMLSIFRLEVVNANINNQGGWKQYLWRAPHITRHWQGMKQSRTSGT